MKIVDLLKKPKIGYSDLRTLEYEGATEAELEELLKKTSLDANAKNDIRKKWKEANGDPYLKVNLSREPFQAHIKKYKTFEGWFNYFFAELNQTQRKEVYMAVLTPQGNPHGDFASVDTKVRDTARREILKKMLGQGFVAYTWNDEFHAPSDSLLTPVDKNVPETDQLRVGFRGELRTPSLVKLHGGCKAKSSVDAVRADMGMNEEWHPFKDRSIRRKAYYRNGSVNQDNCLFTAVSVATDYHVASKFPLMDDLNYDNPGAISTATVWVEKAAEIIEAAKNPAQLHAPVLGVKTAPIHSRETAPLGHVGARKVELACVRMNIYIFTVPYGWDTEAKQSSKGATTFPERATREIPWTNFLARIRCDRIQYSPHDSNQGHLLVIEGHDKLHPPDVILATLKGNKSGVQQLDDFIASVEKIGKLNPDGYGGIHVDPGNCYPVHPIIKVVQSHAHQSWD